MLCDVNKQVPQSTIKKTRNLMCVRSEQSFIKGLDHAKIDCFIKYITKH